VRAVLNEIAWNKMLVHTNIRNVEIGLHFTLFKID